MSIQDLEGEKTTGLRHGDRQDLTLVASPKAFANEPGGNSRTRMGWKTIRVNEVRVEESDLGLTEQSRE